MTEQRKFVREDVRVDDPDLSPEANRLLTAEVQEALGTAHVEIPADEAPDIHRLPDGELRNLRSVLGTNRLLVAVAFVPLLVIGVMISLSTDSWWAVVAACAVHAIGTLVVASVVLRVTTAVERVEPETAARLQEEGVGDPDQALTDLVERLGPGQERDGAAEVVASGRNRVDVRPDEYRGGAQAQQRTALTPSAEPSRPSGTWGMPMLLPIVAVASSLLVAVAVAVFGGGIAWIGALLLLGASVGWLVLERRMAAGERSTGSPQRSVLVTLALVMAAVVAGVIIVGALGGYL
jgi:hypothetical protein